MERLARRMAALVLTGALAAGMTVGLAGCGKSSKPSEGQGVTRNTGSNNPEGNDTSGAGGGATSTTTGYGNR
jgi:hypothetical protein